MSAKLDEILKDVLSGMSDEEFGRCWSEVSDLGGVSLEQLKVLEDNYIRCLDNENT